MRLIAGARQIILWRLWGKRCADIMYGWLAVPLSKFDPGMFASSFCSERFRTSVGLNTRRESHISQTNNNNRKPKKSIQIHLISFTLFTSVTVKIVSSFQLEQTQSRTRLTWAGPPVDDWLHERGEGEIEQEKGEVAGRGEKHVPHMYLFWAGADKGPDHITTHKSVRNVSDWGLIGPMYVALTWPESPNRMTRTTPRHWDRTCVCACVCVWIYICHTY